MTKWSLSPSESFAQSWHLVEESSLRAEPSSGGGGGWGGGPDRSPGEARDETVTVPGCLELRWPMVRLSTHCLSGLM